MRHPLSAITTLVAIAAVTACTFHGGGNYRVVGKVDAPLADAGTIRHVRIENPSGLIRVSEAGAGSARVVSEVLLEQDRPETDFSARFDDHVDVVRNGAELVIRSRHADAADRNDWQLRFDVQIPAGVALSIEQAAGEVTVALPATGDIDVTNAAGNIDVTVARLGGAFRANASAGIVMLRVAESGPQGCDVTCAAGNVALHLPKSVAGRFDLSTAVGNVSVDERFGIATERSVTAASARGTVGSAGNSTAVFKVEAAAGNVQVH